MPDIFKTIESETNMRLSLSTLPLLLALTVIASLCNVAKAAQLSVTLKNPPAEGSVALALFDSANSFGDLRNPARLKIFELDGRDTYLLEDIPAGEYALMVYYDENDNLKIDKNFIGIPTEPLGFSNEYEPKGPPSFSRAAFQLSESELREFTVALYRPMGERGRWGLGVGAIGRTSPYRDYDDNVIRVIPAISYNGERLQILGPNIDFGLLGTGKLRLAATGSYRIGVYEEDDSDYLAGMGDRDDTFMAGLGFNAELPQGVDLALSYKHDVQDNIGGGEARIALDKSFQYGTFRFSPAIGVNWLAQDLANHDFGVPQNKALPGRPAYSVSSTYSLDVGVSVLYEVTTDWLVVLSATTEFFEDEVTDSPIVDEDYVVKGFFAINYLF
ncbi:MAG: MipA/OmpV family protein [Halioglobus sp.]